MTGIKCFSRPGQKLSTWILLTVFAFLLLACAKEEVGKGKITVFNAAPTEITAQLEESTGLGNPVQPGQSFEFSGPVGQTVKIEATLSTPNLFDIVVWTTTYSATPAQLTYNQKPGYFYLKVVNNTSTPYQHVRVENAFNEFDYPVSIPANSTVNIDYFFSLDNAQISIGTFADFYIHSYQRDVDFTIASTSNPVVTLTVN